jgi:hypothetical protein
MPETFDAATQALPPKQEMILKFWKAVAELHAPVDSCFSPSFAPSKERTLRFLQAIHILWASEDAARHNIKQDREGAVGLLRVTIYQACLDGWAVQDKQTLIAAKTPDVKMDGDGFVGSTAVLFCMDAIRNYESFPPTS